MWKWIVDLWNKWFKPKPDPTPIPATHINPSAGYTIRLKTYVPPYKDRRFSVKLDTRFHTEQGMTHENTEVDVDGESLKYYGIDTENGKHDLCFADSWRVHTDLPKPVMLEIFKGRVLHTVVRIPEWTYGAVVVEQEVATSKEG